MADIPMVNPGGKSTMLGQWRVILRQAEELARTGRFDEAAALVARPEVADHRRAVQLRGRMARELIDRAGRRAAADDTAGALDDLDLAERLGAAPDALAAARLKLADGVADEVRTILEAGEPGRARERVEALARRKVSGPALRRAREAAEAWEAARVESRRGEFGRAQEHLDRAERLAAGVAAGALAAARRDVEARQQAAAPKVERLYTALASTRWPEALAAAEAVLEVVPDHPAARQARARAWQQIAALSPSASLPPRPGRPAPPPAEPPAPAPTAADGILWLAGSRPPAVAVAAPSPPAPGPRPSRREGPGGRFLLWADSIGGYLVCLDHEVVLGRAGGDGAADVPLLGDVSRQHATLVRDGDGYVVRANGPTFINGKAVQGVAPLRHGDVLRLGPTLELGFHQPSPVSATARLEILSRHRLPLAVDGVILMAETCIVGPSAQAHVPAPNLREPVVLYRQGAALWCRAPGAFEVDGRACLARAPLTLQSSVLGAGFSFSLEPLGSRTSQV